MNTLVSPGLVSVRGQRGELLRLAIRLDAWISGAFGIALLVGGGPFMDALGAPSTFLWAVGGVCLVYAGALFVLQTRGSIARRAAWTVVVANTVWVILSLLLLVSSWLPVTPLGVALLLAQAAGVAALADLQLVALVRQK
jgi:hypothetical protein